MKFATKAIHSGVVPDPTTGAIMTPIYQTSTYIQSSPGQHKGYEYGRTQNPTRSALEKNLASLENSKYGVCFSSGMAAIDAIVRLLEPGDEIISINDLYGGTYRLMVNVMGVYGIQSKFVDLTKPEILSENLSDRTKLIWIESPTNPLVRIVDIKSITNIAKENDVLVCVDNTFATPFLQRPLDLGADLVTHSATKYLAGHSDVILGAVLTNNQRIAEKLYFLQNAVGAVPGPMDCFLTLRGIKTIHLRVERSCENALAIANYLKAQPKIGNVYYPGLQDHSGHEVAKKQMKAFGAIVSFSLLDDTVAAAQKFMSNTKLFALAESLGGVESLIGHPASMTHASIPSKERLKTGLLDSLIRLSVGIEDIEDLISDLDSVLKLI